MFSICLFDLDQTLINTSDLKEIREAGKNDTSPEYLVKLKVEYLKVKNRQIYSVKTLADIRTKFPDLRLAVFTRSPRSYALAVLDWTYPDFQWDAVVAYEDVEATKPHGEGIDKVMQQFGEKQLDKVVLVGDNDSDVRAAYNAGCRVVLDQSAWPAKWEWDHWAAVNHLPDAVISKTDDLIAVLTDPDPFLPEVERRISGASARGKKTRFEKIGHFIPGSSGKGNKPYHIHVAGRSFAGYDSIEWRRVWHDLTKLIIAQKDASAFPEEWVEAVKSFIREEFPFLAFAGKLIVTVIPHRPGRNGRLELFLAQVEKSVQEDFKRAGAISFIPDLLAYKDGVRSNSNDHLSAIDRFANVRDHLFVKRPEFVNAATPILVIDDVTTSGASLICAKKCLEPAPVTAFSIAKNISNVL